MTDDLFTAFLGLCALFGVWHLSAYAARVVALWWL